MATPPSPELYWGLALKDWLTLGVSVGALIWSIISYLLNKRGSQKSREVADRALDQADQANEIAKTSMLRLSAESEISVLRLMNEARMKVNDIALEMHDIQAGVDDTELTPEVKRHLNRVGETWESSYEILLNAYELACGMYLDDKIDRERFKRQYSEEIRMLMEKSPTRVRERLQAYTSPYRAFRKVYEEFFNLEKPR